jgi:hypothetical protein
MQTHRNSKPLHKLIAGLCLCLATTGGLQAATLITMDLRALSTATTATNGALSTSAAFNITDAHHVTVTPGASGAQLVMGLYVDFNDTQTTDQINNIYANIVSTSSQGSFATGGGGSGALQGYLVNNFNVASGGPVTGVSGSDISSNYPFSGGTKSAAPTVSGTADTITDVGGLISGAATATNYFTASAGLGTYFGDGTQSLLVGVFTLTLGTGVDSGSTSINYFPRTKIGGGTTSYSNFTFKAGSGATAYSMNYLGGINGNDALAGLDYTTLGAVSISIIPEPASWAMLAGGAGILALWQRSRRRAS